MSKNDDYDDDEDEDDSESPFDFSKLLSDPNKLFNSKQFKHIFKEIFEKFSKNLPPEFQNLNPEDIRREIMKNKDKFGFKGPFMYGFNVNIGPDGKPTFDSFGNIKPKPHGRPEVKKVRDPLVEVEELENQIIIIAEMPGVTKEDIELKATTNSLTISTKSGVMGRKYFKEIDLPSPINSSIAKARYKNGLLSIRLKKL